MPGSLDDIFNDDTFGLLNPKEQAPAAKTEEDRLVEAFEEINAFREKNGREPATGSMSEYNLQARLKSFRSDEPKKRILKPFDRFDLLGQVEMPHPTLDQILGEDDLGLLNSTGDHSIFEFRHTPRTTERAKAEVIAQREPMSEEDFGRYELMFKQVHRELKEGKRHLRKFHHYQENLQAGQFYLLEGTLLYLESATTKKVGIKQNEKRIVALDGRTNTIFENGTRSSMLFRSLGKAIQKDGKLVTAPDYVVDDIFQPDTSTVSEDDIASGWVYVLKSKSVNPQITSIPNLFKIGFSTIPVAERIKNAANEATYLFADVELVASYRSYNTNTKHLENLLHRFFAGACINIDIYDQPGSRATPREWFSAPLPEIDAAIKLMLSGKIVNCRFNIEENKIVSK
ncbi:MAG: GIY-YIG nuclease family protein [Sphingobacteriales bacterium]|nr:MAG: GIY-YIG nuclease family protein [Sphingobacteriales bacterium]